jgi:hypothetical protein
LQNQFNQNAQEKRTQFCELMAELQPGLFSRGYSPNSFDWLPIPAAAKTLPHCLT